MDILALALAYSLGTISFSWLAARFLKGTDLRTQGSGTLGARNTLRTLGMKPAVLVFIGDAGKGWLALYFTLRLTQQPSLLLPAALFVILGHIYPFWLGFKGGKGLSTLAGIALYLNPMLLVLLLIIALLGLRITKKTNSAAVCSVITLPFLLSTTTSSIEGIRFVWFWGVLIAALILFRHWRAPKTLQS